MEPEDIQALFAAHGEENLVFISINNNKRIIVDDNNRDRLKWDHANKVLEFIEPEYVLHEMRDFRPFEAVVCTPYSILETMVFRKPKA